MIEVRAYFVDQHLNSAQALAKIISTDWPAINVDYDKDGADVRQYESRHAKNCTDCLGLFIDGLVTIWYIGRHRKRELASVE